MRFTVDEYAIAEMPFTELVEPKALPYRELLAHFNRTACDMDLVVGLAEVWRMLLSEARRQIFFEKQDCLSVVKIAGLRAVSSCFRGVVALPPLLYGRGGTGRSWRIIQLMPNRSCTCPKREAKNVSCIDIKTRPPSESAENTRSASMSLSILSVR